MRQKIAGLATGLLLVLAPCASGQVARYDLLIRGGTVVDGSGAAPSVADVAIADGRIAAVGACDGAEAATVLDARGLVITPGFIDVHAHADDLASRPEAANFVAMGVTTIISGNCGSSNADLETTFARLQQTGISLNFGSLIGHGTVRKAVLGDARRAPSPEELERMRELVRRAMQAGAFGISTGLIYVPGTWADTAELVALAAVAGAHGGLYASHIRNENDQVLDAIDEAIRIGDEAGVKVHISHLKASGKNNWGKGERIIDKLRTARAAGRRVTADQYAYAASSTSLDVLFPSDALGAGFSAFATKVADDGEFRARMTQALYEKMDQVGFGDLSYCRIADAPNDTGLNGLTIAQAAQLRHGSDDRASQARLALDLVSTSAGKRVGMIYHTMSEDDVTTIMRAPFVAVAADAGIQIRPSASRPHPRGAGNNPRVLARYVRELAVLDLAAAVHKMTGLPAEIFGLRDRGAVRPGARADLAVFDPGRIADRATFDDPEQPPAGLSWVIVNGVVVVANNQHTGARPGHVLRHRAAAERQER